MIFDFLPSLDSFSARPDPGSRRSVASMTAGLMVVLVALLASPAQAQFEINDAQTPSTVVPSVKGITAAPWLDHFGEQAGKLLRTSPSVRTTILNDIIVVAAHGPEDVSLSETLSSLLYVIEKDAQVERRLMAIQALQTVGTDHAPKEQYHEAMTRLHELMQTESSQHVRQVAASCLNAHYSQLDAA